MSDPLASIRALIDKWQREGAIKDTFHATMGIGWKVCAEELSAVLASVPPPPQDDEFIARVGKLKDDALSNHWGIAQEFSSGAENHAADAREAEEITATFDEIIRRLSATADRYPEEHLAVRILNDLNTFDQIHPEGIDADRVALIRDTLVKEGK
jgi:hypothetical protein